MGVKAANLARFAAHELHPAGVCCSERLPPNSAERQVGPAGSGPSGAVGKQERSLWSLDGPAA